MTNLAQLNHRVYLELDVVGEFLRIEDVHNAVVQKHCIRVAQSRTSTVNVLLGVSTTFTPADVKVDVTSYIGKGTPAFLEVQDDQLKWQPVRIVPANQLYDYMMMGIMAASFYGEDPADPSGQNVSTEPVQYVEFSLLPAQPCRIRFDRDSVRVGLTENVELPDHVTELIVKEAQNMLIPRVKLAMDVRCRSDKELRDLAKALKQSLSEIWEQNQLDIKPLESLWMTWAFKDRSRDQGTFTKPTPSSRAAYGYGGA